jgi:hypothetical protein
MLDEEESSSLFAPVTLEELLDVLGHFKKEKIPGPDGWTSKFFIFFFDLLGEDLLAMVEETRRLGFVVGGLNDNFSDFDSKDKSPKIFR